MDQAKGRAAARAPASYDSASDIPPRATLRASIVTGVFYLLSAIAVRLTGPRLWGILPDLLARLQMRRVTSRAKSFVQRMRAVLGSNMDDRSLLAMHRRNEAATHQRVIFVAASRRRRGWNPDIILLGGERVEDARTRGKGVILWSDPFVHFPILSKRALAEAGYWAWHLSSSGHGILNSELADRFLNPRVIEVERRYLAGRIVFDRQTTMTAARAIMKVLAANGLVSLTNNAYLGAFVTTPFGEGMVLRLAQTPLRLAALQGVPLLPVLTIERDRFRRYEVTVGPDLSLALPPGAADPVQRLAAIYATYLLERARTEALQFGGWAMMRPDE